LTETIEQTHYYKPLIYIVPPEDDGILLKTVLRGRMHLSRKLLSRVKLTEQGITVNGERRYTNVSVRAGDRVEVRMQEEESEDILPEKMPLDILFEDEHLLILNKPAGTIVHPTHGHYTGTLANGVVHYWREKGENVRFRPVHRLDRETSGVLAVAKTPYVHQHISDQMAKGRVAKEYIALVYGRMITDAGTVDAPIDRHPAEPHFRIVTPDGQTAVTHYRVEAAYRLGSVVRIRLETGRTHQIRVHMRHLGHPVIGDGMYGPDSNHPDNPLFHADDRDAVPEPALFQADERDVVPEPALSQADERDAVPEPALFRADEGGTAANTAPPLEKPVPEPAPLHAYIGAASSHADDRPAYPMNRQALHACKLGFFHPVTGEWREFTADLPADMQATVQYLQRTDNGAEV
jgi:23S rRNA pseudouridine1911/1915/1917 synthase